MCDTCYCVLVLGRSSPNVLWVRAAITDIVPSHPTANTLSSIVPVGMVVASVANMGTGEAAFRGKWVDTQQAFDFWAKRFRDVLDEKRGLSK